LTDKDVDFDRFMARFEALLIEAFLIKALPVDTNELAIPLETYEPVDIDERN
jgi:hypothetical protein